MRLQQSGTGAEFLKKSGFSAKFLKKLPQRQPLASLCIAWAVAGAFLPFCRFGA
ncbi:Uncharacterized protein ChrSV_3862 [Chromobacterium vaccinii]|nr:Uncharacterized protein ChrSW_3862 [Chromobacterium vaccinii]QND91319.1 Uncharacterized protein ChrSV_3862 [Chromobacterium vaccinii]